MRLSQEAIDDLLHIIETFDRERGIPHNYMDHEHDLQSIVVEIKDNEIYILSPKKSAI